MCPTSHSLERCLQSILASKNPGSLLGLGHTHMPILVYSIWLLPIPTFVTLHKVNLGFLIYFSSLSIPRHWFWSIVKSVLNGSLNPSKKSQRKVTCSFDKKKFSVQCRVLQSLTNHQNCFCIEQLRSQKKSFLFHDSISNYFGIFFDLSRLLSLCFDGH